VFVVCQSSQGDEPVGIEKSLDQRIVTVVVEIGSRLVYFVSVGGKIGSLYVIVAEGTNLLEQRRYRIPEVKMIPSNLNRCRFEILEIINRLERAQLSQSRMASSVSVGGGRGSLDVVGASQRVDVSVQLLFEVGRTARSQTAA
jgi:hypothetical protein